MSRPEDEDDSQYMRKENDLSNQDGGQIEGENQLRD